MTWPSDEKRNVQVLKHRATGSIVKRSTLSRHKKFIKIEYDLYEHGYFMGTVYRNLIQVDFITVVFY